MRNQILVNVKQKVISFIKNKKGSDDKNAGSGMSIVFAVVIGLLFLTSVYNFFNKDFLPAVFQKLTDALNFSG